MKVWPRGLTLLILAGTLVAGAVLVGLQTRPASLPYRFTSDGDLVRPEGYREWIVVGTPLTPNDLNRGNAPFPEFHNVYIDPDSFDHWKKTGEFRDGTILMKELISVGDKKASSGKGYFMGEYLGLEATIKSKQHFPNELGNWAILQLWPRLSARRDSHRLSCLGLQRVPRGQRRL